MPIYTVHVPDAAPDAMTQADDIVLVRDGFSGRAFLFGILYLLWHRLWITSVIWILLLGVLATMAGLLHPPAVAMAALVGLMHLYLGAEAADLRRGGLARRGSPMRDLLSAPDLDTAEALFFARSSADPMAFATRVPSRPPTLPPASLPPAPLPAAPLPAATGPAVIGGLFADGSGA
jgi:hypothetical protein